MSSAPDWKPVEVDFNSYTPVQLSIYIHLHLAAGGWNTAHTLNLRLTCRRFLQSKFAKHMNVNTPNFQNRTRAGRLGPAIVIRD